MSNNDQYFPHDYNSFNDPKVVAFTSLSGSEGYGVYWRIIEMLHTEESNQIPKEDYIYIALAKQMSTSVEQIKQIIENATLCKLFVKNDEFIISNRVIKNIQKRKVISEKRSEAGKISALKRTSVEQVLTNVNKEKEKKGKEIKLKEEKKHTKNPFEFFDSLSFDFPKFLKTETKALLTAYIKEIREQKSKLSSTDRAIKMLVKQLTDYSRQRDDIAKIIIEYSYLKGYEVFYEPKNIDELVNRKPAEEPETDEQRIIREAKEAKNLKIRQEAFARLKEIEQTPINFEQNKKLLNQMLGG